VAADLGVPSHRIHYRLDKVRELSGWDTGSMSQRRALVLGLRCFRVLAPVLPG
jgi:sugar diacid utilization regulator